MEKRAEGYIIELNGQILLPWRKGELKEKYQCADLGEVMSFLGQGCEIFFNSDLVDKWQLPVHFEQATISDANSVPYARIGRAPAELEADPSGVYLTVLDSRILRPDVLAGFAALRHPGMAFGKPPCQVRLASLAGLLDQGKVAFLPLIQLKQLYYTFLEHPVIHKRLPLLDAAAISQYEELTAHLKQLGFENVIKDLRQFHGQDGFIVKTTKLARAEGQSTGESVHFTLKFDRVNNKVVLWSYYGFLSRETAEGTRNIQDFFPVYGFPEHLKALDAYYHLREAYLKKYSFAQPKKHTYKDAGKRRSMDDDLTKGRRAG